MIGNVRSSSAGQHQTSLIPADVLQTVSKRAPTAEEAIRKDGQGFAPGTTDAQITDSRIENMERWQSAGNEEYVRPAHKGRLYVSTSRQDPETMSDVVSAARIELSTTL